MARVSKYEGGSKSKSFRLPSKFFEKAVKEVEGLLSKYEKKPMALVFPQITGGISIGAKTYYDINMDNIPSEKTKNFFLAATPGEPEKRIPGTLKKKLKEIDPNITIPGDKKNKT